MKYTKSKSELLEWLNQIIKAQYRTIEECSDAVGYLQVIDAIHSDVPVRRLNLSSKIPEDNLRNLRILDQVLKKLGIKEKFQFDKMAERKVSQNLYFLQWLYVYGNAYNQQELMQYEGYRRRLQILQKQGRSVKDMSSHLRSFAQQYHPYINPHYQQNDNRHQEEEQIDDVEEQPDQQPQSQFIRKLQSSLKKQMQMNWKLMNNMDSFIDQRNTLYFVLNDIYKDVSEMGPGQLRNRLEEILTECPTDFLPADN